MLKRRSRRLRILLISLSCILAVVICFSCICIALASDDIYEGRYTMTRTDDSLLRTVLKGSLRGQEFTVTEDQFNSYVNAHFCNYSPEKGSGLEKIRFYFHKNEPVEIFARIHIRGKSFGIRCNADIGFDPDTHIFTVTVRDQYIGRLHLHSLTIKQIMKKLFESTDKITASENNAVAKAEFSYDIASTSFRLYLTKLSTGNGCLICRSNSLTGEALKVAVSYLTSEKGQRLISDIWDNIRNK